VRELLEAHGGRLVSWYLSFGEYDGLLIYEAPDDASAGALILAAARREHLGATKTTPLFTAEESSQIMRRAGRRVSGHQGTKKTNHEKASKHATNTGLHPFP
jgi:uncharacterized protein with GYD domain